MIKSIPIHQDLKIIDSLISSDLVKDLLFARFLQHYKFYSDRTNFIHKNIDGQLEF